MWWTFWSRRWRDADSTSRWNSARNPKQHTVQVVAILNDTTGCLMSTAWREPKCRIGLILGTGTNACYLEDLDKVRTWIFRLHGSRHARKEMLGIVSRAIGISNASFYGRFKKLLLWRTSVNDYASSDFFCDSFLMQHFIKDLKTFFRLLTDSSME